MSEEEAAQARAEAEARRKRILEASNTRLGIVSGELPASQAKEAEGEEKAASSSSRLQAMRRRRFKKSKPKSDEEADAAKPDEDTKPKEEAKEIKPKEEVKEIKPDEEVKETKPKEEIKPDDIVVVQQEETTPTETTVNTEETTTEQQEPSETKKYQGVAKMRRRKLLEKKQKAQEPAEVTPEQPSTAPTKTLVPDITARRRPVFPIVMHILTVLLLFGAGLDVGLQPSHFLPPQQVHRQLVIQEYPFTLPQKTPLKMLEQDWSAPEHEAEDEFADEDTEKLPNLDPLFQVDLDELTQGPGFFNQLARMAVAVHRLILQICYYKPRNLLLGLWTLPQRLLETPPVLCLIALVTRQVVAKLILGAHIPPPDEASSKDVQVDLLDMLKQGVLKFLTSSFPTVVGLYDAWSHLRADMYVILCGVFCGLAWSHSFSVQDEDIYGTVDADDVVGMEDTGGLTDEL